MLHKKTLWITESLYHSARNQTQLLISYRSKVSVHAQNRTEVRRRGALTEKDKIYRK